LNWASASEGDSETDIPLSDAAVFPSKVTRPDENTGEFEIDDVAPGECIVSREAWRTGSSSSSATSDASGHFSTEHIAAGRYDLRARRVGYLATQYGQDKADKPGAVLTLVAGQKTTDLLFRLP
jgi:hypothetical protein